MRPQLAACVAKWRKDWSLEMQRRHAMGQHAKLEEETHARQATEAALVESNAEYERKLQAALRERTLLADRVAALEKEVERSEAMRDRLATERERAQAAVREGALRRFLKQGLARGWLAWKDSHRDQLEQKRLLRTAAARLMRPQLAACVAKWRKDWEAEWLARERSAVQQELAEKEERAAVLAAELELARQEAEANASKASKMAEAHESITSQEEERGFEILKLSKERDMLTQELKMERVALEDERKKTLSLLERLEQIDAKVRESADAERRAREEKARAEAEAKKHREKLDGLETAMGGAADPKQAAEERLAKLLAEQRATLEAAQARFKQESAQQLGELRKDKKRLEHRIAELEARFQTWTGPKHEQPPEPPERVTKSDQAVTQFKAFTFSSDKRAEERRKREEEEKRIAEEAARLAEKERLRVALSSFDLHGGLNSWIGRKGQGRHPPSGLSPELKRAWYQKREEYLMTVAATKLQAVYRGKLARRGRKQRLSRGSGESGGSVELNSPSRHGSPPRSPPKGGDDGEHGMTTPMRKQ